MKIFIQILLVTVYVSLSFAQQNVKLTVKKTNIERDLALIKLFQDADIEPTVIFNAKTPPWVWSGTVNTINGNVSLTAVPVDEAGQEGSRSPEVIIDPPPDGSDITIEVVVE